MIEFIILACLILLNGLLVMSELALISAKKNRLEGSAAKGDRKSKAVLDAEGKSGCISVNYSDLYYPYFNFNRCLFRRKIWRIFKAIY